MALLNRFAAAFRNRIFDRPEVLFFSSNARSAARDVAVETVFPAPEALGAFLADFPQFKEQHTLYESRFRAGDQLCLTKYQGRVAHVSWFGVRDRIDADYELGPDKPWSLKQRSGLIYDCWTEPGHRGLGLYPSTLNTLKDKLLDQTPEVWIYCRAENTASRRGIEKAGFQFRGSLASLKIFGRYFHV